MLPIGNGRRVVEAWAFDGISVRKPSYRLLSASRPISFEICSLHTGRYVRAFKELSERFHVSLLLVADSETSQKPAEYTVWQTFKFERFHPCGWKSGTLHGPLRCEPLAIGR